MQAKYDEPNFIFTQKSTETERWRWVYRFIENIFIKPDGFKKSSAGRQNKLNEHRGCY